MAGAEDSAEDERWGKHKLDFLRRLLPFARGIPSHEALNDVMNALPAPFSPRASPPGWRTCARPSPTPSPSPLDRLRGKAAWRAQRSDTATPHLVSVRISRRGLVLGQEAVSG